MSEGSHQNQVIVRNVFKGEFEIYLHFELLNCAELAESAKYY
jgi:hypothetical protein